jgi:hypothetical protein
LFIGHTQENWWCRYIFPIYPTINWKLRNQLIVLEGTNHLVLFHTPETGVRSGFLAPFNNSHHLWATCYGPNPKIKPNSFPCVFVSKTVIQFPNSMGLWWFMGFPL